MNPDLPKTDAANEEDSLEELRAKLLALREERKESLDKHKKTTYQAVEAARGTTWFDVGRLKQRIEEEEGRETDASTDDAS